MSDLRRGRIVWTQMSDRQGRNLKRRPAVVISSDQEINPDGEVWVVACTTQFNQTLSDITVELPWEHGIHPKTKLKGQCFAVCDWLKKIRVADIEDFAGNLPGKWLLKVLQIIANLPREDVPDSFKL